MIIKREEKYSSNWKKKFAWMPVKARINRSENDEHFWIWLEQYTRYYNYGAPVNYLDVTNE